MEHIIETLQQDVIKKQNGSIKLRLCYTSDNRYIVIKDDDDIIGTGTYESEADAVYQLELLRYEGQ